MAPNAPSPRDVVYGRPLWILNLRNVDVTLCGAVVSADGLEALGMVAQSVSHIFRAQYAKRRFEKLRRFIGITAFVISNELK